MVVAIDAKRHDDRFAVYARSGTTAAARDAVEWAREAADRGAGEILLTSIDRDGTQAGIRLRDDRGRLDAPSTFPSSRPAAPAASTISPTCSRTARADAALAASIFHFAEHSVTDLKTHLRRSGIPVRLSGIKEDKAGYVRARVSKAGQA